MAPVCFRGGWWIFPAVMMLVMLTFAFFMFRRGHFPMCNNDHFRRPAGSLESAEEILKKRYAAGEISHEDFQRIRDEIR